MKKKQIITIAGRPGSGKSTTSKAVASQLGYRHFSSGDLFRTIGKERGIDVTQTNLAAEKEEEIDYLVDQRLRDIGQQDNDIVIDSRLAWHWIPDSFKVYLDLDLEEAARRILGAVDHARLQSEQLSSDPVSYAGELGRRLEIETRRYKAKYQVDPYDHANFDLVVDTAAYPIDQVVQRILDAYQAWLTT